MGRERSADWAPLKPTCFVFSAICCDGKMSQPAFYWARHKKYALSGRLVWYANPADKGFWSDHWGRQLVDTYYPGAEEARLEKDETGAILLRHLTKTGRHLEAGCGAGYWVAALQKRGYAIEGIEYASELVRQVKERASYLNIRCADALQIDAPDEAYDSYISFGVVEHREEGPEPFLSEACRVLCPKGILLLSVPYFGPLRFQKARLGRYEWTKPSEQFFQYGFTRAEFEGLLRSSGFAVLETHRLFLHRLLIEENRAYRLLVYRRGGGALKRLVSHLLKGRDGHMILFVARKG